ncbi:MBG domain-containing protein [Candidatus Parcubacteria bacterium]|nr:MBG domain-containing protein [Candidatus Parcubacteria bacterium]
MNYSLEEFSGFTLKKAWAFAVGKKSTSFMIILSIVLSLSTPFILYPVAANAIAPQPDLVVTKTNNVGGTTTVNSSFNWVLTITNPGSKFANFTASTQVVLKDELPTSGATYGIPSIVLSAGINGTLSCSVSTNILTCTPSSSALKINPGDTITVTLPVTAIASGILNNPRSGGTCSVDTDSNVIESDEANNTCSNSVNIPGITVTPSITSSNKVYDGTTTATSSCSLTGVVNPDVVTCSATTTNFDNKNVGTSKIVTATGITLSGADAGKYQLSSATATTIANITAKALTVTADSKTKVYGAVDPALSYLITTGSLVVPDTLSGSLVRVAGENVGSYAINQGTLANSNYAITYVGSNLTITQKAITVTPHSNQSKIFGASEPVLTYSVTSGSLVVPDAFTGALSRTAGESVGNYSINVGDLSAGPNYNLTFSTGVTFEITSAEAAITINSLDLNPVYNGNPKSVGAVTSPSGLSYSVTYNGSPDAPTNAGTYTVQATITNPDYSGSDTKTLTIHKATPVIVVTPYDVIYDGNPHTATGTATGAQSESLTGLDVSATTHTNASTYTEDPWTFTDTTGNYNNQNGTITDVIHKKDQTITFGPLGNKVLGDADFTVSATATSELAVTLTADGNCSITGTTVHITDVGTCTITAHQAGNDNVNAAPDAGQTFTISAAPVATHTLTYTAGANGSIAGTSPQTVNHGASGSAVTPTANSGFHFVNWSDESTANPRTDSNVTADISVTANFAANPTPIVVSSGGGGGGGGRGVTTYTVTATVGINGSVTPAGAVSVVAGNSQTYTIAPNAGFQVASVLVDGASVGAVTSYTFNTILADHTISATFSGVLGANTTLFVTPGDNTPSAYNPPATDNGGSGSTGQPKVSGSTDTIVGTDTETPPPTDTTDTPKVEATSDQTAALSNTGSFWPWFWLILLLIILALLYYWYRRSQDNKKNNSPK